VEPVGYLEADAPAERTAAAARILEALLRSEGRYRAASRLHIEAVRRDYEELKRKHDALLDSEARYRELAAQLDERVKAQVRTIEATQRQLYQSEKMAAVGQLAAGIAHEINTPIAFIRSNLNTALDYRKRIAGVLQSAALHDGELDFILDDLRDLLRESMAGAERVGRIVAALKDFSHVDRNAMEDADLNALVRSVCEVLAPEAAGKARFVLELESLPPVRCHAGNLGQVFYNLLLNAVQATEAGGTICVRSQSTTPDEVRVIVEDDGVGIAPEHLGRVFEPFFTTREVGKGTGLGLTVSHDIVRAHGGELAIDSSPGKGTRVTVVLPTAGSAAAA
ncbi:MAG: sensor histidine kinase, partial [Thiohalomonadaceae bacterium]